MASRRNKKRMKVNADRLSNLPDHIIHKILSSFDMKAVVQTSSLSSRWRFLWTSMPCLNFSSRGRSLQEFYESVREVLRTRDNQIQVSSLDLCIDGPCRNKFVNSVLRYAFRHDVEKMKIQCNTEFHLFNFSSKSLKVLNLAWIDFDYSRICKRKWELPALITLNFIGVTLYDDEDYGYTDNYKVVSEAWDEFFSKSPNLKYLTIDGCTIGNDGFRIRHPQLSNLKLANGGWGLNTFTVDTPQLKNLSIINCGLVELVSAPELASLVYRHPDEFEFEVECCLPSLEKVDLCIRNPHRGNMKDIVDVLEKFRSVKFLTINAEIPELLSSRLVSVSDKPSPFANLKSLKIYPAIIDADDEYDYSKDDEYDELQYEDEEDEDKEDENEEEDEDEDDEANICAEVKDYFLNSSPSATVTNVTCQEIRAVTTPELAVNLMEELQLLLKEEKAKINQQNKTQVMKKTEERVLTTTESRWKDPSVQNYLENGMIGHMVSKLQAIEGVLATFPTTKRAKMKACFRRLFAEAKLVMKKINAKQKEFDTKWGKQYKRFKFRNCGN